MTNIKNIPIRRVRRISAVTLIYIFMLAATVLVVFPYIWMLLTAFKSDTEAVGLVLTFFPSEWIFKNFSDIWTIVPFMRGVFNTLIVEVSVILVGTFVSAMAAFSFAKLKLKAKTFWLLFLMSGMMVPYAALMTPQYRTFYALGMVDTLWPLILPGFFGNIAMIFFLTQYMRGIPTALLEAAKIDGSGYFRMFTVIMLPLCKMAIAAQVIFWFVGIWNDFFAPSIYLKSWANMTLQPMLARINSDNSSGTRLPLIMAGSILASVPMLIIYISFQKYFVQSIVISGVKG